MNKPLRTRTIKVSNLARVEGEGALYLKARGQRVVDLRLEIFEPPRFFEAFLRGRHYSEAPDITARICGICPVAYQMSACQAMEAILGLQIPQPIRDLRHLLYVGEWVESHVLHIAMLHAPDFLGYQSALEMARDYKAQVELSLRLKRLGNDLMILVGGREIHPINVRVGGFYSVPRPQDLRAWQGPVERGLEDAITLLRWVQTFEFPDFEQDYEFVALQHPTEYAILEGRLVSNKGIDAPIAHFFQIFEEYQVPHSNALHLRVRERDAYMVGPLARLNLNADRLRPIARQLLDEIPIPLPWRNPFLSILARAIEVVHALEVALDILQNYQEPDTPFVEAPARAGTGYGITEAPRGILYHHYTIDSQGLIQEARIVAPTTQNLHQIEQDLWAFAPQVLHLPKEQATWLCEQAIRNYDPCISCATHFLQLHIHHED